MNVYVTVTDPEWECDPATVLDHQHPGYFNKMLDIPHWERMMDDVQKTDAIHQQLIDQCGLCLIDGEIEWHVENEVVFTSDEEDELSSPLDV